MDGGMDVDAGPIGAWRDRHDDLAARWRVAARLAPERDPASFGPAWAAFDGALRAHLAIEEELLLPVFAAIGDDGGAVPPNQLAHVVQADHAQILALADQAGRDVRDVSEVCARAEALAALAAVLDHHDRREAQGMFAALDRHVDAAQRASWWATIAVREAVVGPACAIAPSVAPAAWPVPAGAAPADGLLAALAMDGEVDLAAAALPPLPGPHGQRVSRGLGAAVARWQGASVLADRRDALFDGIDALRRWRAVAGAR